VQKCFYLVGETSDKRAQQMRTLGPAANQGERHIGKLAVLNDEDVPEAPAVGDAHT
jgi:hypothetical protein